MRGQGDILVFLLLSLIGLVLVFSAMSWGQGVFAGSSDATKFENARAFMGRLDTAIVSASRFGGEESVAMGLEGTLKLVQNTSDPLDVSLVFSMPSNLELPADWAPVNTANASKAGCIADTTSVLMQRKNGAEVELKLFYRTRDGYAILPYTDGSRVMSTGIVTVAGGGSEKLGGITVSKVKLGLGG